MLSKESKATSNAKDEFIKGQTRAAKAGWYFTGLCTLSGGRHWWIKPGRTHSISSCVCRQFLEELTGSKARLA